MAAIITQYDPAWEAFQKSYQAEHPLVQSPESKSDEARLNQALQGIYDPNSPNYHKYVTDFNTQFPGVAAWQKQQSDFNAAMRAAFESQYGHGPVLNTTVVGPPVTPPAVTPPANPKRTDPIQSIAPVTAPPNPQPAAVTPPSTSPLSQTNLVTAPLASPTSVPFMVPSGTVGGSFKFPDLLKQTQKRWGFGSPTRR